MGKILSSRETSDELQDLQELVFVLHAVLNRDEDEPETHRDLLLLQLQNATLDVAELVQTLAAKLQSLSMDVIQLSLQNAAQQSRLKTASDLIQRVLRQPGGPAFDTAREMLARDATPVLYEDGRPQELMFTENTLETAFSDALQAYLHGLVEETL